MYLNTPPDVIDQMTNQPYQMFLVYEPEQLQVQEKFSFKVLPKIYKQNIEEIIGGSRWGGVGVYHSTKLLAMLTQGG